jgi:TDG/mug DNA glycosylase family protein
VGLTPRQLAPDEFELALTYGVGLTDLCRLRSGSDAELGRDAFDVAGLTARIASSAPRCLAFNGVKAAREPLGQVDGYGPQSRSVAGVGTWVLPSTSGAANGFWDLEIWRRLAASLV